MHRNQFSLERNDNERTDLFESDLNNINVFDRQTSATKQFSSDRKSFEATPVISFVVLVFDHFLIQVYFN